VASEPSESSLIASYCRGARGRRGSSSGRARSSIGANRRGLAPGDSPESCRREAQVVRGGPPLASRLLAFAPARVRERLVVGTAYEHLISLRDGTLAGGLAEAVEQGLRRLHRLPTPVVLADDGALERLRLGSATPLGVDHVPAIRCDRRQLCTSLGLLDHRLYSIEELANWRASRAVAPAASTRGTESAAATSGAKARLRSCLVHRHGARVVLLAIQALDRGLRGLVICHLDETEALRAARVAVHDDRGGLDAAELPEQSLQVFLGCVVTEISDVEFLRHLGLGLSL